MDPVAQGLADQGFKALKGGDSELARAYFERSIEVQPNPVAYNRLSVALTRLENWGETRFAGAEAAIAKSLELEEGYPPALYNRAVQHARKGEFEKALEIFEKGVFPNGQAFIDGAKDDGHLDGFRPEGMLKSTDGYAFADAAGNIPTATRAQMERFAKLVGVELPPAAGSAASESIPGTSLHLSDGSQEAWGDTFEEGVAAKSPARAVVHMAGMGADHSIPRWFDKDSAALTSRMGQTELGQVDAVVSDRDENLIVLRAAAADRDFSVTFVQAGKKWGDGQPITPLIARQVLELIPAAVERSPLGPERARATLVEPFESFLRVRQDEPEILNYC
ncbi:MAG: tetratricopeptide repeat protein [Myxococcaceae bacterium]